jgi:CRP/FNR family cyclic AMP-dependent transcriptional regulator
MYANDWIKLDLSNKEKMARLVATRIGKDLDESAAEYIATQMSAYGLQPDHFICRQGDDSSYLCIISSGRANIVRTDSEGNEKIIATVGPGHPLGELSLFDHEPRSASAVASTPVEMIVLDLFSFEYLCENNPRIWAKLIKPLVKSMTRRLRQTSTVLADYLKY